MANIIRVFHAEAKPEMEAESRGWLPVMGVVLSEEQIERILKEAEQDLGQYVTPDGTVEFDSPAHIVTGWKS